MFPDWEEGLERILKVMEVDHESDQIGNYTSTYYFTIYISGCSTKKIQTQIFKGEKQFFVGRQNYINQIIKDKLRNPGSKVSIVGPGGSGKSQLAFKAMHEYVKEGIFDLVIPIYFDEGLLPFDKFLWQIGRDNGSQGQMNSN